MAWDLLIDTISVACVAMFVLCIGGVLARQQHQLTYVAFNGPLNRSYKISTMEYVIYHFLDLGEMDAVGVIKG